MSIVQKDEGIKENIHKRELTIPGQHHCSNYRSSLNEYISNNKKNREYVTKQRHLLNKPTYSNEKNKGDVSEQTYPYNQRLYSDGFHASFNKISTELDLLLPTYGDGINTSESRSIRILDAGCGVGCLPERIDLKKYNTELYGIDNVHVSVAVARSKRKYKDVYLSPLDEELPYNSKFFDFVISNEMLSYCVTHKPIYEFVRVLKSGGYILITMRTHHYIDRKYPDAIKELEEMGICITLRQKRYLPFPNNKQFTNHEYMYTLIKRY